MLPRTHFWTLMQLWGTQNKTRLFLNSIACIDYRIDVVNGFKSHGNHGTIIPFTRLRNTESYRVSLNCQSNSSKLHMQEALDGRLLDDPQHIVNTASGQPCLESCSAFIPGYLRHAIHYAALFSHSPQQVALNLFVSDKCERAAQSRRMQKCLQPF